MVATMRFDKWENPTSTASVTMDQISGGSGLVPVVPSSISVSGGTATANSSYAITFSGATSLSLNNCFTSLYDSYRVIVSDFVYSDAGQVDVSLRFRSAGADVTTASYQSQYTRVYSGGSSANGGGNSASIFYLGQKSTGGTGNIVWEPQNPALAKATTGIFTAHNYQSDIATYIVSSGGLTFSGTAAFDGFTILKGGSGTMGGTVRVYGYR